MIRPVGAVVPVPAPTPRLPGGPALVPLGEITCLERVVGLLQQCGLAQVAVVAEAADRPALDLAGRAGALPVIHSGRRGRLARIRTGLTALDPGLRAVFLLPANIPLVRPATIRRLLEAYCAGGPALIRPVCCGRPGWPVLLDAGQIPALIAEFSPGGLHAALARLAEETVAIEVADEYIRLGLSSPADVERLREHLARYGLPTEAELNTLQQRLFPASPGGLAHAQAVARVALTLAQALNAARAGGSEPALDTALVRAAALLHDLAKNRREHEAEGGRILRELGFRTIARIVAAHRDLTPPPGPLTEREIVYLADKLVACHHPVTIAARFQSKIDQWPDRPDIQADIRRRLANAWAVAARFEAEAGQSLETTLAAAGIRLAAQAPEGLRRTGGVAPCTPTRRE